MSNDSLKAQKPKRSLGQNFLIDPNYQRKIVQCVRKDYQGQTIVEIGPGKGAITNHLKTFADKLILIEKDKNFAEHWRNDFAGNENFQVIESDVLEIDMTLFLDKTCRVIGNLPYNISTQILIQFLQHMNKFESLTFMFQKEVAMRCLARPGKKDFGPLAVWAQLFSKVSKVCDVPPTAFRPKPNVVSTVLHFERSDTVYTNELGKFMKFVRVLFSQRRKQIGGVLKKAGFDIAKIENTFHSKRAEQLTIIEMQGLYQSFKS